MKKLLFLGLFTALFAFNACKEDDDTTTDALEYAVEIESPNSTDKAVGDMLDIHVHFTEENGATIHNVNVRIYNKDTGAEIYSKPDDSHKHATGSYDFEDQVELTEAGHWVLEAKVWGHDGTEDEVKSSVEFHVN